MKLFRKRWILIVSLIIIVLILLGKILSNTTEIAAHNLKGASGNIVYISEDGHKEAVYDSKGQLVTDPTNMGSYNYYYYKEHPFRHFFFDTAPWILWGNSEADTSTVGERIAAFSKDFSAGVRITFMMENN